MKLYFAFSNIILLTQTNIQANISKEEGDLLVWSTTPIDYHLVETIKKKGVFRNVWYLERPRIQGGKHIWNQIKNRRYEKKFYFENLDRLLSEQRYDEFVVAGFWNDALIILKYLKRNNPNIKIGVSEEGLKSYYCGKLHKKLYYTPGATKKEIIKAYLRGGRLFKYAQKNIIADYLTAPALLEQEIGNEIFSLPAIDEKNPIMLSLVQELFYEYQKKFSDLIYEYKTRKVFYLDGPANRAYDPVDYTNDILRAIMEEVPLELLLLKTHTNHTALRKTFGSDLNQKVFIDRNVYLFEVLFSHIFEDEKPNIFIVRNSSVAIYLTQMFKIEPIFIFIHRLSSRYHYGWDNCGDLYISDLRNNVKHPERILVPNSYVELKVLLNGLCKENIQNVESYEPKYVLEQISLSSSVMKKVETAISIVMHKKEIFEKWGMAGYFENEKAIILNFYGKEGSGKRMAAESVAQYLGKRVCYIKGSDLGMKHMESSKVVIQKVFECAMRDSAVLIVSEADIFLERQSTMEEQPLYYDINVILKTFLSELEKFEGIIIFISNSLDSSNYNDLFKNKTIFSVYFDEYNKYAKEELWKMHLKNEFPLCNGVTVESLAGRYDEISEEDIRDMIFYAALYIYEQSKEGLDFEAFDYAYIIVRQRYEKQNQIGLAKDGLEEREI